MAARDLGHCHVGETGKFGRGKYPNHYMGRKSEKQGDQRPERRRGRRTQLPKQDERGMVEALCGEEMARWLQNKPIMLPGYAPV